MQNYFIKGFLVLACLALVSMPLSAQKGGGACATAGVQLSQSTATPGGASFGIFGGVSNCSSQRQRYDVEITFMSACGVETVLASSVIRFNPFENRLISTAGLIPSGTCLGAGTVTLSVYGGSSLLASASAPLTIQ